MIISEAGKYRARCIDDVSNIRWGMSKNGIPQLALTFALTDDEGRTTDTTIDGAFSLDEKKNAKGTSAYSITEKALRICGWRTGSLDDLSGINDNEVELDVQWEEYNGESRLRIKWVNKPGGHRLTFKDSMSQADIKALAARFRGASEASKPKGGGTDPAGGSGADKPPF
jgi:hypothetical protein